MENKLSVSKNDLAKAAQLAKADGSPYSRLFDEEYAQMSEDERTKLDESMAHLADLLGIDDDDD